MNMPSPIEKREVGKIKTMIIVFWPMMVGFVILILIYVPRDLISTLVLPAEKVAAVEQQRKLAEHQQQVSKLNEEIKRLRQQLGFYKQKSQKVNLTSGAKQVFLPDLIHHFMSWEDWQRQHPNARFADFRNDQIKHYKNELQKAQTVFDKLKSVQ